MVAALLVFGAMIIAGSLIYMAQPKPENNGLTLTSQLEGVFTKLSSQQIASLAASAGFRDMDLLTAVAVALAESGGNPSAYNPEKAANTPEGKGSYGLWQVYLKAHPEFEGVDLFDPQINAYAAFQVYSMAGGHFKPWSTYNGGQYTAHIQAAEAGIAEYNG